MKHLPLLLPLLLCSCIATSGDIRAVQYELEDLKEDAEEYQKGYITQGQYIDEVQTAVQNVRVIADEAVKRASDAGGTLWDLAKGNPIETIMAILGMVGASAATTNKYRDVKRVKLGADYVPGPQKR